MWRQKNKREDGGWEYPPLETSMEEAGFEQMVEAEYGCAVHLNAAKSGPMQEDGAEARFYNDEENT